MKVGTSILAGLLFAVIAILPIAAQPGQAPADGHVTQDQARELYRRSVFAHGYMHGYEDGFHLGDFDLQTGHNSRDLRQVKQFREAKSGYQRAFGNPEEFRTAYRLGFSMGYGDAMAGREFRAVRAVRRAAHGLIDPPHPGPGTSISFDRGFGQGYESGKVHGEVAGRKQASYNSSPSACVASAHPPAGLSQDFCDGYARGYLLGYDDGYLSGGFTPELEITASNQ